MPEFIEACVGASDNTDDEMAAVCLSVDGSSSCGTYVCPLCCRLLFAIY